MEPSNYPLLQEHPALADALPVPLGLLRPTPLESAAGLADTWIKRDDRSAEGYGGNKIRKLDFVLAEARDRRRPAIVCFGYAGSNFVAATAWHARAVGIPESVIVDLWERLVEASIAYELVAFDRR